MGKTDISYVVYEQKRINRNVQKRVDNAVGVDIYAVWKKVIKIRINNKFGKSDSSRLITIDFEFSFIHSF